MPIKVLMPALSPTMTEGNLAKWHKKVGDKIKPGEVIAEIETDKATMEVEAADEGVLGQILVAEGTQAVKVNELIAVLLEEGESDASLQSFTNSESLSAQGNRTSSPAADASKPSEITQKSTINPTSGNVNRNADRAFTNIDGKAGSTDAQARILASPLAKRIAEQNHVNVAGIAGSGPNGRVVRADVEAVIASGGGAAVQPTSFSAPVGVNAKMLADQLGMKYTAQPNSNIRKVIAKRLLESKQTVPHFYLTVECRMDKLLALRQDINAAGGHKISVNDLIIKASALALKKVPAANASWHEDAILLYDHADISVAVATPNGLITPIIKAAETKSVGQISAEMKDLAARARDGKLRPEEFQGGSFSISNLGMFGITEFAAIINPPQACILAVGASVQKPVVEGDKIMIGTTMNVTLSVDHRAVDGAVGAEFLQAFRALIENPGLMLV